MSIKGPGSSPGAGSIFALLELFFLVEYFSLFNGSGLVVVCFWCINTTSPSSGLSFWVIHTLFVYSLVILCTTPLVPNPPSGKCGLIYVFYYFFESLKFFLLFLLYLYYSYAVCNTVPTAGRFATMQVLIRRGKDCVGLNNRF